MNFWKCCISYMEFVAAYDAHRAASALGTGTSKLGYLASLFSTG